MRERPDSPRSRPASTGLTASSTAPAALALSALILMVATRLAAADAPDKKPEAAAPGATTRADEQPAPPGGVREQIDPMSVNATCYVCHMTFVREEISKVHFKEKVTCIKCHGLSAGHANDEHVGATKPDKLYKRHQIDAMCAECHEDHDAPAVEVIARFLECKPNQSPAVCTDCHGKHKIEPPAEE